MRFNLVILAITWLAFFYQSVLAFDDDEKYKVYKFEYREADDCLCSMNPDICGGRYLVDMQNRMLFVWHPPNEINHEEIKVRYKIHKNGRVSDIKLINKVKSPLALSCLKAVQDAAPFSMLPADAPEEVEMQFTFPIKKEFAKLRRFNSDEPVTAPQAVPYTSRFRPMKTYFEMSIAPYLMNLNEKIRRTYNQRNLGSYSTVVEFEYTMNADGKIYNFGPRKGQTLSEQELFEIVKKSSPIDLPPGLPGEIRIKFRFDPKVKEPYISEAQIIQL